MDNLLKLPRVFPEKSLFKRKAEEKVFKSLLLTSFGSHCFEI